MITGSGAKKCGAIRTRGIGTVLLESAAPGRQWTAASDNPRAGNVQTAYPRIQEVTGRSCIFVMSGWVVFLMGEQAIGQERAPSRVPPTRTSAAAAPAPRTPQGPAPLGVTPRLAQVPRPRVPRDLRGISVIARTAAACRRDSAILGIPYFGNQDVPVQIHSPDLQLRVWAEGYSVHGRSRQSALRGPRQRLDATSTRCLPITRKPRAKRTSIRSRTSNSASTGSVTASRSTNSIPAPRHSPKRSCHPEMQGQSIGDGPLPFLFGAKADTMKSRYWIREITPNRQHGRRILARSDSQAGGRCSQLRQIAGAVGETERRKGNNWFPRR